MMDRVVTGMAGFCHNTWSYTLLDTGYRIWYQGLADLCAFTHCNKQETHGVWPSGPE